MSFGKPFNNLNGRWTARQSFVASSWRHPLLDWSTWMIRQRMDVTGFSKTTTTTEQLLLDGHSTKTAVLWTLFVVGVADDPFYLSIVGNKNRICSVLASLSSGTGALGAYCKQGLMSSSSGRSILFVQFETIADTACDFSCDRVK